MDLSKQVRSKSRIFIFGFLKRRGFIQNLIVTIFLGVNLLLFQNCSNRTFVDKPEIGSRTINSSRNPDPGTNPSPNPSANPKVENTYYISPSGSDSNPGTINAPFASMAKAYLVVKPGDLIYVRGGNYYVSTQLNLNKSGTSEKPFRIWAYPGEKPVFNADGFTVEPSWVLRFSDASYWHIKGFEIKNNPHGGAIYIGDNSNNNIIENNNVHHNGNQSSWAGTGIVMYGNPSNNLILNNDSHNNKDIDNGDGDGLAGCSTGNGNILRGNRVWNNSDDGIDLFNTNDNQEGGILLVENNWAWDNGYNSDHVPYPNGDGNGFKLGGQRAGKTNTTSGGHTVRNNLAWGNSSNGFDENSSSRPLKVYNNTAWNNKSNFSFWENAIATGHNLFYNNLSFGNLGSVVGKSIFNSWNLSVTVNSSDFISLDTSCAVSPRQLDGSLPNCDFLRLVAGSDLIDRGIDIGLPFSGRAPDLGALEK